MILQIRDKFVFYYDVKLKLEFKKNDDKYHVFNFYL